MPLVSNGVILYYSVSEKLFKAPSPNVQAPADNAEWSDFEFNVCEQGRNNLHRSRAQSFDPSTRSFSYQGDYHFEIKNYEYPQIGKTVKMPFMSGGGGIEVEHIAQV